jgi:isocitrate/isopropylmalate dehydrogenase
VSNEREIDLGVVGGDGIGPEVVAEALKVARAALAGTGVTLRETQYDLGAARWHRTGETITDEEVEALRAHEAILLGAVGDPSVPSGVLERGLLLRLRFALDHYVNLRPAKLLAGVDSPLANPGTIDLVVVREGTEGPSATPSPARSRASARSSRSSTSTTSSCTPATCGGARSTRSPRSTPRSPSTTATSTPP